TDPHRRISSFSSQGAVFSLSDFSELEQTSSANLSVWWAGVDFTGRISNSSTSTPARAHCSAASQPASPPPMILIGLWFTSAPLLPSYPRAAPAPVQSAAWFPSLPGYSRQAPHKT